MFFSMSLTASTWLTISPSSLVSLESVGEEGDMYAKAISSDVGLPFDVRRLPFTFPWETECMACFVSLRERPGGIQDTAQVNADICHAMPHHALTSKS